MNSEMHHGTLRCPAIVFALAGAVIGLLTLRVSAKSHTQSAGQQRPTLVLQTGHSGAINAIALSPDGRFLVSGSDDSTVKMWDVATGIVLRTFFGHEKAVLAAAISHDGRLIASGGEDGSVRLWDVMSGDALGVAVHVDSVKELAFSSDGRQLTSLGSRELKIWDVGTARALRQTSLVDQKDQVASATADMNATALTADGRLAAVGGGFSIRSGLFRFGASIRAHPIRIIESATGREIDAFKLQGSLPTPVDLRFSPDGRLLVAKLLEASSRSPGQSTLVVFDVGTGRELKRLPSGDPTLTGGIEFSPDGKLLASRTNAFDGGGTITLFDVGSWREVRQLSNTGADVPNRDRGLASTPLTFSADGRRLAASLGDGIVLFDAETGKSVARLRTTARRTALSTTPGPSMSERIAGQSGLTSDEYSEMMRDVSRSRRSDRSTRDRALGAQVSPITFTPDGKRLSVPGSMTVWDTVDGMPRPRSESLDRMLASAFSTDDVAYSPDGKLKAVAGGFRFDAASIQAAQTAAASRDAVTLGKFWNEAQSTVTIEDVATHTVVQTIKMGRATADTFVDMGPIAFGARGFVAQFCERRMRGRGSSTCHVQTFDPATGRVLHDFKPGNDVVAAMDGQFGARAVLSPQGRFLVSFDMGAPKLDRGIASRFGIGRPSIDTLRQPFTMKGIDVATGRGVWEIKGEAASMDIVPAVSFSPDDTVLAVSSVEKDRPTIRLHETTSGRVLAAIDVGTGVISAMSFSHDSRRLALTYGTDAPRSTAPVRGAARSFSGNHLVNVYDLSTGRQTFTLEHDVPVSGMAFSPSGRVIVTASEDLTQYVWDVGTGEKLATLVNLDAVTGLAETPEWLVVAPDGLFDGSPGAWPQIMWRFSRNTFDVGPVESFFNELYYPGLAAEIFAGRRPRAPRDLQQIDRRQPSVAVTAPTAAVASRTVTVKIDVAEAAADGTHSAGSGARDVRLFRNGTLVKLWSGDVLRGRPRVTLETAVTVVEGENHLTAYAFNRENVKSVDASVDVIGSAALARKGTAYVLAVGVNQYANGQYNLRFAGADATMFGDELKVQQLKLDRFQHVEVVRLLDRDATKANLLLALRRLATGVALPASAPQDLSRLGGAEPEDAVIIYFAGHGTAKGARFYLVPHDLGYDGPRARINAQAVETILAHSVSDLELEAAVQELDAGNLVLVVDACNSGQALEAEEKRRGPMNSKGLAQLAYEKGMYVLTAAQSYQAALETSQLGHGYLTFTLVEEGLRGAMADRAQKDGQISVREWFDYATTRVPELQQNSTDARLLLEMDDKLTDQDPVRNLQRPRAFYRRESERLPVIIGKRD